MQQQLSFGKRLAAARIAAGMTQAALAEKSGVSVKAISAIESGKRPTPGVDTVCALAGALGMTAEECGLFVCPELTRAA